MNYDDEYTYFDYHVVIDGYKKLRNVHATNGASCICIGSCSMILILIARRIALAHACKIIWDLKIGRFQTLYNFFHIVRIKILEL